jgi:cell volume regulation protein A
LALALFLAVVARPAVVLLCLAPFRLPWREVVYVGWVGLRGAVPIVLATIPVIGGVVGGRDLFDVVFFVVVVGALVPGATVPWITRRLGVEVPGGEAPRASIEIDAPHALETELRSFYIDRSVAVAGALVSEVPFPAGAAVTVIEREGELFAPTGATQIVPGDHVYVFARREDRPHVDLLFGRPDVEDEE